MFTLELIDDTYGIARLEPSADDPRWARGPGLVSVTRTPEELSVVCPDRRIPPEVTAERGWSVFRVAGQLDFALTGVIHALTEPLAEARIGVFVLSTYDTDYLAVREAERARATERLTQAGHWVEAPTRRG